ncbi:MAG: hypothetical protein JJ992_30295, partial [Planctomycetes bacterium]|nr:hypothetical protein [Planctomycetota bacterium]
MCGTIIAILLILPGSAGTVLATVEITYADQEQAGRVEVTLTSRRLLANELGRFERAIKNRSISTPHARSPFSNRSPFMRRFSSSMPFRSCFVRALAISFAALTSPVFSQEVIPPPNAPAESQWDTTSGELALDYHGARILTATVTARDAKGNRVAVSFHASTNASDERVEQTLAFTPAEGKGDTTLVF